ncbi:MAG TPA: DUF4215 domain-containing protein [Polyangiaceae bacterium]|nr:DUF4215 domain-containing protein [Polyangiaceae bacterium]
MSSSPHSDPSVTTLNPSSRRASSWLIALSIGALTAYGCSAGSNTPPGVGDGSGGSANGTGNGGSGNSGNGSSKGGTSNIDIDGGGGDPATGGTGNEVMEGGCGDGILQPSLGEVCDDGNNAASDGCAADCTLVEQNFVCLMPGAPCTSTVMCGDGIVSGAETCDDGNVAGSDGCDVFCALEPGWVCPVVGERCDAALCGDGIVAGLEECEDNDGATPAAGDGCSATCQVELGWVCETVGQACRQAVCGDGVVEGGEPCDDLDDIVGDGCSPGCVAEPVCDHPVDANGCSSQCGDGIILPGDSEECDDGNRLNGDGCSDTCEEEDGYECVPMPGSLPGSIKLPFVYRDFVAYPAEDGAIQRHPDFQNGCLGNVIENMVSDTLDADGKPLNSGACVLPAAPSCVPDVDYTDPTMDNCLNRDGCTVAVSNCQRSTHPNHPLVGHAGVDPFYFWYRDTADVNRRETEIITLNLVGNLYRFAPNGGFFPMNDKGWVAELEELERNGNNYGFTTEVRYWFQFQGGETLTFEGDDDLFVFVNGQLALPIGSKHGATARTVVLNTDDTATCAACADTSRPVDLTVGNVYEIAIFHAERQADASNFKLDLTGFVGAKSECSPVCGDGTQTPDEKCDNGDANSNTEYGGCTETCTRGPRCGDAVLQVGNEQCDDGTNLTTYSTTGMAGCAPGCTLSAYCGDAKVDGLFGEQCDDGVNAGGYNGCASNCTLGPRCGDGQVQNGEEQCDDGNLVTGDGCSSMCENEAPK